MLKIIIGCNPPLSLFPQKFSFVAKNVGQNAYLLDKEIFSGDTRYNLATCLKIIVVKRVEAIQEEN